MHAVVTGASSGIGEAVARELARRGVDITLVARRKAVLDRVAAELPTKSHTIAHDLSDPSRVHEILEEASRALGPVDILVSNAGFMTLGPIASFDPAEADRLVAINMLTPMRLISAALPGMIARGRGTIVNVTSIAAFVSLPGWAHQSASKTASAIFSESLQSELEGTGVHALTVYPGLTETPMKSSGLASYGDLGVARFLPVASPDAFATVICDAIDRKKRRIVYPRFYWLTRWFPRISAFLSERFGPRPDPARLTQGAAASKP